MKMESDETEVEVVMVVDLETVIIIRVIALSIGHTATPIPRIKHGFLPLKFIKVFPVFFKYYNRGSGTSGSNCGVVLVTKWLK